MAEVFDAEPVADMGYDREYDIYLAYSNIEQVDRNVYTSYWRKITATVVGNTDWTVELELDVVDHINVGPEELVAYYDSTPGTTSDQEQFAAELEVDKADIDLYQSKEVPNGFKDRYPVEKAVVPLIREWSNETPFRADVDVPEES
jgi:hypothetical protein